MEKPNHFAIASSVIGIFMILVAGLIDMNVLSVPLSKGNWSKDDADAYEASAMAFHNATFDKKISEEERQKKEDAYLENREKLDAVLTRGNWLPNCLQYGGYGFVALGVAFYVFGAVRTSH